MSTGEVIRRHDSAHHSAAPLVDDEAVADAVFHFAQGQECIRVLDEPKRREFMIAATKRVLETCAAIACITKQEVHRICSAVVESLYR